MERLSMPYDMDEAQDEDASNLKLPEDLEDVKYFNNSEVHILLEEVKKKRLQEAEKLANATEYDENLDDVPQIGIPEILDVTLDYTEQVRLFKSETSVNAVRRMLSKYELGLHPFEQATLANLCPHTPEEAQSFMSSLENRSYADLMLVLEDVCLKRSLQY
ncbi:DNA-directed RNA polymerase II subunit Rpb4-like [Scaptodrosophila lebanonensis]|uniref:DNA-directed RNA polymerase II subunit Rpb4-like n=1 Tax=Drosophila lebanonensis TaxID=7225 RepID=A0A6J2U1M3_DROLE|nr:DNA-directed RNA polymerase II subunit Rpb4-like [Scaptodrosophila lebanonensis]